MNTVRTLVAALLISSLVGASMARAQEWAITSPNIANTVVTGYPIAPPAPPGEWNYLPPDEPAHKGPVASCVRNHACWSHHNMFGCSTVHSELTFLFGSCRDFFGGPCLKGPPPALVPAGYEPPTAAPCASCGWH